MVPFLRYRRITHSVIPIGSDPAGTLPCQLLLPPIPVLDRLHPGTCPAGPARSFPGHETSPSGTNQLLLSPSGCDPRSARPRESGHRNALAA
ncbi:hypothetical protein E2C01_020159 [Portunus trituberculatus]|uniref:Uncharacterized protein n=1 Tax=Portunus trituberculatus TaxID=210409 RepID=A0A5B7E0Z8_PORTR|nr:hypothetical protein [Portunus trituberculatus]